MRCLEEKRWYWRRQSKSKQVGERKSKDQGLVGADLAQPLPKWGEERRKQLLTSLTHLLPEWPGARCQMEILSEPCGVQQVVPSFMVLWVGGAQLACVPCTLVDGELLGLELAEDSHGRNCPTRPCPSPAWLLGWVSWDNMGRDSYPHLSV